MDRRELLKAGGVLAGGVLLTGFRDPARILATGASSAREVTVADGDVYVAGLV
ncbi:hypothetical protein [Planotetraspora sp. GP83]|uniref:hypothetical protein n=1 Tax=Planotetraspora sp. GP83 TaxID=3156264 RepID=UPI003513BA0E